MKKVIITGDDFGLAVPVNEAIIEAHERGILTTASLMVTGAAFSDAVQRARAVPSLKVGLHLVLVEGRPATPPETIAGLLNTNGEFSSNLTRSGIRFFFRPRIRRQLQAEIRSQFELFRETGLDLDHVNAHNHMHLHPTVLLLMLRIGREYGMRAVRLPYEPPLRSWQAAGGSLVARVATWWFLSPWMALMKHRLRRQDVHFNDFVFGMADSGNMTAERVIAFLKKLPEGITEIYFHPATRRCAEIDGTMPKYRHREEFEALTSDSVAQALRDARVASITFSDL